MKLPPRSSSPRPRQAARAFTLVEVVISVGVASVMLIAMAMTIPMGLSSMRSAHENSAMGAIMKKVSAEVTQVPFESVRLFAEQHGEASPLLFDLDGRRVEEVSSASFRAVLSLRDGGYPGLTPGQNAAAVEFVEVRIDRVVPGTANPIADSTGDSQRLVIVPRT